jgi:glycosyltransferase involved in cell wall biosynthesis
MKMKKQKYACLPARQGSRIRSGMTTKPLVSVIMPVYNAGEFLVRAIESIRKQTITDFELLIIDDGSTDDSWDIIKRYAKRDVRIRKFRNRKNIGIVKSMNLLIPKTKGRFVARMDADDISLPNRFEKQIAYLETHPQLVACGGQEHIINERGRTIAEKYFPTDEKTCYNMIANIMVIQPPVLMARGDVFRKLRYSNHTFKNDDISMHFKLLQHGGFGNVDDIIFKYRKRQTSLTHKNPRHVFFLALLVRLKAIKNYGYAPSLVNIFLLGAEALVVSVLPNRAIIAIFELIRHTKAYKRDTMNIRYAAPFFNS